MLTLTFAGAAPDLEAADNARRIFFKRFSRRYPNTCAIWVREYGAETGRIHFHVLIYGSDHLPIKRLRECWLYGALHARRLARPAYMSKYLSKRSPKADDPGRWWGIFNRTLYAMIADRQRIELPRDVACEWRRLIRGIARKSLHRKLFTSRSFCDPRPYLIWKSHGQFDIKHPNLYNIGAPTNYKEVEPLQAGLSLTPKLSPPSVAVALDHSGFNWWQLISYIAGIVQTLSSDTLDHDQKKEKATELIKSYYISLPVQPIPVYLIDLIFPALIEQVYRWTVK